LGEQPATQRINAFAADNRNGRDIAPGEAGLGQRLRDLRRHNLTAPVENKIDFGQSDDPARNTKQIDNSKMLAGLRHDAVVGRYDQQNEIDAARVRQHVVDKFFVTGHVDETKHLAVRRLQIRETEIDAYGRAPFLL